MVQKKRSCVTIIKQYSSKQIGSRVSQNKCNKQKVEVITRVISGAHNSHKHEEIRFYYMSVYCKFKD